MRGDGHCRRRAVKGLLCALVVVGQLCIGVVGILSRPLCASPPGVMAYVFSNVRPVGDPDNYVGTEIVVRVDWITGKVTGQWDIYHGHEPQTVQLAGELRGSRLQMRGIDSDLRPMLTAAFSERQLRGVLVWYLDSELQTEKVQLHRVQGRLQDLRFLQTAGWKRILPR